VLYSNNPTMQFISGYLASVSSAFALPFARSNWSVSVPTI